MSSHGLTTAPSVSRIVVSWASTFAKQDFPESLTRDEWFNSCADSSNEHRYRDVGLRTFRKAEESTLVASRCRY